MPNPIRLGDSGPNVKELQTLLDNYSKYIKARAISPGTIDSQFGESTRLAVMAFQEQVFIPRTGIVADLTWRSLYKRGPVDLPELKFGESSDSVKLLEERLIRLFARLIYEADAHVFPDDRKFREIAKAVFVEWQLWDEMLNLQVDGAIGKSFKGLTDADPATLARVILRHAEALQLPAGSVRLVNPRLVTTTRHIDKVQEGKSSQIKTITEHYLEYVYEQSETVVDYSSGEPVAMTFYGGGTLVMDADWNATLLATFPLRYTPREPSEGGRGGWRGARTDLDETHGADLQRLLAARKEGSDGDRISVPGCSFGLERSGLGGYRLVRHRCNLHDRGMGQSMTEHGIVQS